MILTVTLNPALDLTYGVAGLTPGDTHRVREVSVRAGGKGLNVARVLADFAVPVRATGFLGGATGDQIAAQLDQSPVDVRFVTISAESRRTLVVADGRTATGFWEPGPRVTAAEWDAFVDGFAPLLDGVGVAVLSGSLPPDVPESAYEVLTTIARSAGVRVILDTDGPALRAGLRAGPDAVKPNRSELGAATGRPVATVPDAVAAARALRPSPGTAVVATLGADGLILSTVEGQWWAGLAEPGTGYLNATGAGDACVAALAAGALRDRPWTEVIVDAVAWSATAAAAPTAGTVDPAGAARLHPTVVVEAL